MMPRQRTAFCVLFPPLRTQQPHVLPCGKLRNTPWIRLRPGGELQGSAPLQVPRESPLLSEYMALLWLECFCFLCSQQNTGFKNHVLENVAKTPPHLVLSMSRCTQSLISHSLQLEFCMLISKRKFSPHPFTPMFIPRKIKGVHIYRLSIYSLTHVPNSPFDLAGEILGNVGKYCLPFNSEEIGNPPISKYAIKPPNQLTYGKEELICKSVSSPQR